MDLLVELNFHGLITFLVVLPSLSVEVIIRGVDSLPTSISPSPDFVNIPLIENLVSCPILYPVEYIPIALAFVLINNRATIIKFFI